jgi:CHAT domain-containing protein/predicted negative regulator of RcsB-dependent stress response
MKQNRFRTIIVLSLHNCRKMRYGLIVLLTFFFNQFALKGQSSHKDVALASIKDINKSQTLSPSNRVAPLLDSLRKLKERPSINDSIYTKLLRKIGWAYIDQSDHITGIKYFHKAINVITGNISKPGINSKELIKSYYWLSTFYDTLNNIKEKIKALDSCISVSQRLNASSEFECIRSLETRAAHYFDLGDYHRCITDAALCEQLAWKYTAMNANDKKNAEAGTMVALTSIGWLIESLAGLKKFKEAEDFFKNKMETFKKAGLLRYQGFAYSQMAQLEVHKGNYSQALLFFNKAIDIEKRGGSAFTCKQILNAIGHDIFFKQGDESKALQFYKKALAYTNREHQKERDDSIETLQILSRIGNLYVKQGDFDVAFAHYQKAFDMVRRGMTEKDILNVEQVGTFKKVHLIAGLVIDKGNAFLEKYKQHKKPADVREAIRIYKVADKLLVLIRANHFDLQSKLFWRSQSRRLYEQAIESCHLSGDANEAFYFFEKSRAVLLNEQLAQHNALSIQDIASQVQLKKRMLSLEREVQLTEPDSKKRLDIENRLFLTRQEIDRLTAIIKAKNPLYYQAVLDTAVISIAGVRKIILKDHQALLEIFSGDSAVYALLITTDKIVLQKINKVSFESTVKEYITFFENPGLLNKDFGSYKITAHRLYKLLFQNLAVPVGRIIISPDERGFPFESLIVKDPLASPVYFLNEHAVSYTYSARYLMNSFTSGITGSWGEFMGVAPVHFQQSLYALPGSDRSIERIGSYFKTAQNLLATNASKNNFIKHFSNYKIIQVYTHAAASGNTQEPIIHFADSALYLSDLIAENKPVTRLIVLSACETGNGQFYSGEGVFNFNRGFAAYGIPSAITNLWSVDNHATYRLTELFYKYLSQTMPVDIALQLAKKEFIQTGSLLEQLPYYWAAAILTGRTDAPVIKQDHSKITYLLIAGIFCLCVFAAIIFRRSRAHIISV